MLQPVGRKMFFLTLFLIKLGFNPENKLAF